ncbi:MAG: 50S ribosomal protein L3 [Acidobacteriota bacterium]
MLKGLIGKKVGMTQIFLENGTAVPVTVVSAGPCVVVQTKTQEADGYRAVQIGLVERISSRRVTKARRGHFEKAGLPPCRFLKEFRLGEEDEVKVGETIRADTFQAGDIVSVTGRSRGRGFAGVIKRHHFSGGAATHGSMFHRAPGSIGQSAYPSRVFKGMRGPGHMGASACTVKNLKVVKVDAQGNKLFLRGGVPGSPNSYLIIRGVSGS